MSVARQIINRVSTLLGINTTTAGSVVEAILEQRESARVAQIRVFRDYYDGKSIPYVSEEGELPYVNLSYSAVEKSVSWLVGDKPIIRPREDIEDVIGELCHELLDNSGSETFYRDLFVEGGVTGDAVSKLDYRSDVNDGRGGFLFKVMDSERTFVEYRNVGQSRSLSRVMIIWDELDQYGKVETYLEIWDDKRVRVYPPGPPASTKELPEGYEFVKLEIDDPYDMNGYEFEEWLHPFGELPFVHIPNIQIPHNVHGRSDLHDLWIINREVNEQLLSYKDNVDYHGNPITIIKGASVRDLERGADKVWGNLPKDSDVFNLEVAQTHQAILEYIKLLEKAAGHSAFPSNLMGLDQQVFGDGSTAAVRLQFLPLIELTKRKAVSYKKGLKSLYGLGLRMLNRFYDLGLEDLNGLDTYTARRLSKMQGILPDDKLAKIIDMRMKPFYSVEIEFVDHLPRNRALELADIVVELQNNLATIPEALERLGKTNIESKLEEIVENAEFVAQIQQIMTPPMPGEEPVETDPEVGGRGNKKEPGNTAKIEEETGQAADRTQTQRSYKGTGDQ